MFYYTKLNVFNILLIVLILTSSCNTIKAVKEFRSNVEFVKGMDALKAGDGATAVEELSKASSRKDEVSNAAKIALADIYFEGKLRPQNLEKARELYLEIANQNDDLVNKRFALHKLGLIFYEGIGVEVSNKKAAKYFFRSLKDNESIEDNFYLNNLLKRPEIYVEIFEKKFKQSPVCKVLSSDKNNNRLKQPCLGLFLKDNEKKTSSIVKKYSSRILSISNNSPAEKFGLKIDDNIIDMDGKYINNSNKLISEINKKKPGDLVNLKILRKGKLFSKELRLGYQDKINLKFGFQMIEEKKYKESFKFFENYARKGNPVAQRVLGSLYLEGKGIKKNIKMGLAWVYIAALNGDVSSQSQLGYEYYNGKNTGTDLQKSVDWHKKAVKQGSSVSKNDLALIYMNKEIIENYFPNLDYGFTSKYAFELINSLKDENNPIYLFNLGLMYKDAIGTRMDLNKAKKFFIEAANLGDKKSLNELKLLQNVKLENDDTIPKNKIKKINSFKSNKISSGFYVSKFRHIVTNQHAVNQCKKITVGNSMKTQILADLIASDKRNDLAILQTISMEMASEGTKSFVQKLAIQIVPALSGGLMRSDDVVGGEEIFVAGYPFGNMVSDQMKLTDGIVSATKGLDNDVSQFEISSVVRKGNSGGPIYDSKGNIVGVVVERFNVNRSDNVNFAIKGSTVKQFLSAHNVSTKWSNRQNNMSTKDIYKLASKQTVMVVCHR